MRGEMRASSVEGSGIEPRWPGSALLASVSEGVGSKRREWLQFSAYTLAPHLALPGHILAKLRRCRGGMEGESPVTVRSLSAAWAFYGGLYQILRNCLYAIPLVGDPKEERKSAGKECKRVRSVSRREAELMYNKGLEYEKALDIQSAIACLEQACYLQPNNITYLARLSKQWSDISFAPGVKCERARELNRQALQLAERIMLKDPKNVLGNIALCVSKGRLAYFSDNRTKVHLAREAEDIARRAVILHPRNDLIHHLLGRWHYEMAALNIFSRAIVRLVYGATLHPGSYQGALAELQEASRLAPNRIIHYVQLGKTHFKLGNREEAARALERALELEVLDINDYLEMKDGAKLLKRIYGVRRTPWDVRLNKMVPARPLFCE